MVDTSRVDFSSSSSRKISPALLNCTRVRGHFEAGLGAFKPICLHPIAGRRRYPTVCNTAFSALNCRHLSDSVQVLVADDTIVCSDITAVGVTGVATTQASSFHMCLLRSYSSLYIYVCCYIYICMLLYIYMYAAIYIHMYVIFACRICMKTSVHT